MAKELPYFKFFVSEWLLGNISSENDRIQGIFIQCCAHYWHKECCISYTELCKKLGKSKVKVMLELKYIKNNDSGISIEFLDEQWIELSDLQTKREKAGRKGGQVSVKQRLSKTKANVKHLDKDKIKIRKDNIIKETWKDNFEIYLDQLREVYNKLINDKSFIKEQEKFNPNVNIKLSIEKACKNFWGTEAGWKHKKGKRSKDIDWKTTLVNAISMNKVYKDKDYKIHISPESLADIKKREATAMSRVSSPGKIGNLIDNKLKNP